jgi:pyridinium-3,5-biscarboxylic acid mononucleotide sulfurtransferase
MTKFAALRESIKKKKRLAVMFSGGLDSALLCLISKETLGENTIAVNIDSPVTPSFEKVQAADVAEEIGINLLTVKLDELKDADFSSNPPDRCYICRKIRQRTVKKALSGSGFDVVADGVNLDDLSDYRPGIKAADEDGIWHPFAEHGFSKSELRDAAKDFGLSVWNKEPSPCMCTRFAYGMLIEHSDIEKLDKFEEYLRKLCKGPLRVRCFPLGICLIETNDFKSILNNRTGIADMMRRSGFVFAGLDIEGFVSGKMNRLLNSPDDKIHKGARKMAKCAKTAASKDAKPAAKKSGCAKSAKGCGAKKKA